MTLHDRAAARIDRLLNHLSRHCEPHEVATLRTHRDQLVAELVASVRGAVEVLFPSERHAVVLDRPEVLERWPIPHETIARESRNLLVLHETGRVRIMAGDAALAPADLATEPVAKPATDDPHPWRLALAAGLARAKMTGEWPKDGHGVVIAKWRSERIEAHGKRRRDETLIAWSRYLRRDFDALRSAAIRKAVESGASPDGLPWWTGLDDTGWWDGPVYRDLPAIGVAWLHAAEIAIESGTPRPLTGGLVAVDRIPRHVTAAIAGGEPRAFTGATSTVTRVPHEDASRAPIRWDFKWDNGDSAVLDLPFEGDRPILSEVARQYGPDAVRHLGAMYLFAWLARTNAGQPFWWWPDEHLDVLNLVSTESQAQLVKLASDPREGTSLLARLHRTTITTHYRDRQKISAPILGITAWESASGRSPGAVSIAFHPAMYEGITSETGDAGNYFWPVPLKLLQRKANAGSVVHVLPSVLGGMWRMDLRDAKAEGRPCRARKHAGDLVSVLGIRGRGDSRRTDERTAATLRQTLDDARTLGLILDWRVTGGQLDDLSGIVEATASPNMPQLPPRLPATGDDVAAWLERAGWSQRTAAAHLDVQQRTISRGIERQNRPIPSELRRAFRRFLWRAPDPGEASGKGEA